MLNNQQTMYILAFNQPISFYVAVIILPSPEACPDEESDEAVSVSLAASILLAERVIIRLLSSTSETTKLYPAKFRENPSLGICPAYNYEANICE